ncbi:MAG: hypothetical protein PHO89_08570 [Methylacidiphilaceae bacterium]|nr:hypothetical protein [Candidatus Methylacidiphilaceae bacterium]
MLGRDTHWRQGDLPTRESASTLGLVKAEDNEQRAIVITHDCDLASDKEPFVEVIVAKRITGKRDSTLSYAKNPRRLHLRFEGGEADPLVLELRHVRRQLVPNEEFARHAARETAAPLSAAEKRTLKHWLAARYGRPAFPNAFEARLRKSVRGETVEQRIVCRTGPELATPTETHRIGGHARKTHLMSIAGDPIAQRPMPCITNAWRN